MTGRHARAPQTGAPIAESIAQASSAVEGRAACARRAAGRGCGVYHFRCRAMIGDRGLTDGARSATREQALALNRYEVDVPPAVKTWLENPHRKRPNPAVRLLRGCKIAHRPRARAGGSGSEAQAMGFACRSRRCHRRRSASCSARPCRLRCARREKSCVLISGGETTVTVTGEGRGGRNSEYLLALALALNGAPDIWAIAATPTASTAPRPTPATSTRYARSRRTVGTNAQTADAQRCLRILSRPRRSRRDRSGTHQCQRFSRDPCPAVVGVGRFTTAWASSSGRLPKAFQLLGRERECRSSSSLSCNPHGAAASFSFSCQAAIVIGQMQLIQASVIALLRSTSASCARSRLRSAAPRLT